MPPATRPSPAARPVMGCRAWHSTATTFWRFTRRRRKQSGWLDAAVGQRCFERAHLSHAAPRGRHGRLHVPHARRGRGGKPRCPILRLRTHLLNAALVGEPRADCPGSSGEPPRSSRRITLPRMPLARPRHGSDAYLRGPTSERSGSSPRGRQAGHHPGCRPRWRPCRTRWRTIRGSSSWVWESASAAAPSRLPRASTISLVRTPVRHAYLRAWLRRSGRRGRP